MTKECINKEKCANPNGPVLSREEFYKENSKDGRKIRCKACWRKANKQYELNNHDKRSAQKKQYYIDNKDRITVAHKTYKENNKDKTRESGKKYRLENAEKIKITHQAYRDNNKDKRSAYNKQWERDNRGKSRAKVVRRRTQQINALPSWADLDKIRELYKDCAAINLIARMVGCSEKFTVDHVIPLQGKLASGLHVENNLQIMTASENFKKSNKFTPVFQQFGREAA